MESILLVTLFVFSANFITKNYYAFLVHQRHLLSLLHFKFLKPSLILFLIVVY